MSNPNKTSFSANQDEDNSEEEYTPFSSKPANKPLKLNDSLIKFSLNTEKEQAAHRAHEETAATEKKSKEKKEDTPEPSSKRKKVSSSIRKLLKINRSNRDISAKPAEFILPGNSNLAVANLGVVAANLEPNAQQAETSPAENFSEKPSEDKSAKLETESIAALTEIKQEADPNTAKTTPSAPPKPPRPPRFGTRSGGAGNIPPVPPAVTAANYMPASPSPATYNQAPVIIDRRNNWGPALIVGLTERFFRRRADKRLDRKIEKNNDQIQQTQEELTAEKRSRRAEQSSQIPHTRSEVAPLPSAQTARGETNIVNTVEQRTESTLTPEEIKYSESLSKPVKAAEVFAASPLAREIAEREVAQKEIKKQAEYYSSAEKQAEKLPPQPLNEAVLDRRHEVKDSASAQPRTPVAVLPTPLKASGTPSIASDATTSKIVDDSSQQAQPQTSASPPASNIYKQSLQAGFALGLSVAILGMIALIVLK